MNGKRLPPLRIEPGEAVRLFEFASTEEMYRVQDLCSAYRQSMGTDPDRVWDSMKLLSFVYDTARVQGIREERAKEKSRSSVGSR